MIFLFPCPCKGYLGKVDRRSFLSKHLNLVRKVHQSKQNKDEVECYGVLQLHLRDLDGMGSHNLEDPT